MKWGEVLVFPTGFSPNPIEDHDSIFLRLQSTASQGNRKPPPQPHLLRIRLPHNVSLPMLASLNYQSGRRIVNPF
jgi:hypothetical protein